MKDNERYYFEIGRGDWNGIFTFQIKDWQAFLRASMPLTARGSAVFLHVLGRLVREQLSAQMNGIAASDVARSRVLVRADWVPMTWLLPDSLDTRIKLFDLHGRYVLDPDGTSVIGEMHEQYGPIPFLIERKEATTALIGPGGLSATYRRQLFGSTWVGRYTIDIQNPVARKVSAVYTEEQTKWGELTYEVGSRSMRAALKPSPPVDGEISLAPPKATRERDRLIEIAKELREHADDQRARGSLLSTFTALYSHETFLVADAVGAPNCFSDPKWTSEVAIQFARRYLDAVRAFERQAYVSPVWREVLAVVEEGRLTELDAVALCIFAHIRGDLPFVLAKFPDLEKHVDDYETCNALLCGDIDAAQKELWERFGAVFRVFDAIIGRLEETFVGVELRQLRTAAWYDSFRLKAASPAERPAIERGITDGIADFLSDVMDPSPTAGMLALTIVRRVAQRLRGRIGTSASLFVASVADRSPMEKIDAR